MAVTAPVRETLALELSAVVVAVTADEPRVLAVDGGGALPSGPLEPGHRTLERGLRDWVEERTRLPLGYVEQLYTFADRGRAGAPSTRVISLSYLALAREAEVAMLPGAGWHNWYRYFPWEDWRGGRNGLVADRIVPLLEAWAAEVTGEAGRDRRRRVAVTFGTDERSWDEELVLQRFELLYEARLVPEALRDLGIDGPAPLPGERMALDHRRILATGIARLRAKIKYRPVVFELMPERFTLLQLQRAVEALAGRRLHKQNFRRFVEGQKLVEEAGGSSSASGGRPAKLMRFRREVLLRRAVSGTKLPLSRPG
ncbi:MAG TPA: hypothetical protein VKS60_04225 [Stellaceae bacterium]|nr:hypothetical protein [Stellaceae bacterium]